MTLDKCVALANTQGYKYAGAENGQECWASNDIITSGGAGGPSTNCNAPCAGEAHAFF